MLIPLILGAIAIWLLLPRGGRWGRSVGAVLGATALGLAAAQLPSLGNWAADGVFWLLAGTAIVAAIGAVTFSNPVYCAVWFGLSLMGVAGLFLSAGAQFLAVATIVVYAGAILVTFLFVLMLAKPEGKAIYDRVSWEALLSSVVGMVLVGVLSMAIGSDFTGSNAHRLETAAPTEAALAEGILTPDHVSRFGESLWSRFLIPVEAAGLLLFAALVAAAVIVRKEEDKHLDTDEKSASSA